MYIYTQTLNKYLHLKASGFPSNVSETIKTTSADGDSIYFSFWWNRASCKNKTCQTIDCWIHGWLYGETKITTNLDKGKCLVFGYEEESFRLQRRSLVGEKPLASAPDHDLPNVVEIEHSPTRSFTSPFTLKGSTDFQMGFRQNPYLPVIWVEGKVNDVVHHHEKGAPGMMWAQLPKP